MNTDFEKLDNMPVSKVVLTNAIPAMLAMVMVLVYNMADLFFIGQTGDDLQVAAISMATPLFLLFLSLGNVFGLGGASLLSRNIGSGNQENVGKIASLCFWSSIFVGIGISLIVYFYAVPIVTSMGASEDILDMVCSYVQILSYSGVFLLITCCYSALVRAEGKPEKAMGGMMVGNVINIVLDPIFILWLDMGVEGAAYATVIGNFMGGCYYLRYLWKEDTTLSTKLSDFSLKEGLLLQILLIGIPASLTSLLTGTAQMLINSQMAQYGDMAVAGVGVAMKCTMISSMICIGMGNGVQPLLGYAIGSNQEEKYRDILKFSLKFAFCVSATLTILCYLALTPIVNAFVTDPEAFQYAYQFSAILISTSVLVGLLFIFSNALQAAGAVKSAFIINVSRQGLFFIPFLYLCGNVWGMDGLIYAQPIADGCTFLLALVVYGKVSKTFFQNKNVLTKNERG